MNAPALAAAARPTRSRRVALSSRMRPAVHPDGGFTLIELLVVVVIIGILIAIAIPLYLNYRKGANDKAAQSDLRGAISTLEQCNSDNNRYPDTIPSTGGNPTGTCTTARINVSDGTKMQYVAKSDKANFIVWTRNDNGGNKLYCYASESAGTVKTTTATALPGATYAASC